LIELSYDIYSDDGRNPHLAYKVKHAKKKSNGEGEIYIRNEKIRIEEEACKVPLSLQLCSCYP